MKFHPEILAIFTSANVAASIYCALAIGLIAGGAAILRRRHKTKHRRIRTQAPTPAIKAKGRENKTSDHQSVAVKNNAANGHAGPRPLFRRRRRKRIFNYSKFYTSVIKELSQHTYHSAAITHAKSRAHGHSQGHIASNGVNVNPTAKSDLNDLIAQRNILIQTQKALLEEQARLIQEKNRMIEEQTSFHKRKAA
ncbi:MAG TPA: hypothetical protein VMH87_09790 [Pseudomonadales bacterium]|nr:hypothetical protein [Pseudomonadales bacterium]